MKRKTNFKDLYIKNVENTERLLNNNPYWIGEKIDVAKDYWKIKDGKSIKVKKGTYYKDDENYENMVQILGGKIVNGKVIQTKRKMAKDFAILNSNGFKDFDEFKLAKIKSYVYYYERNCKKYNLNFKTSYKFKKRIGQFLYHVNKTLEYIKYDTLDLNLQEYIGLLVRTELQAHIKDINRYSKSFELFNELIDKIRMRAAIDFYQKRLESKGVIRENFRCFTEDDE